MIKTVGLLAILLLLYGLAGRADYEIASATAKARDGCCSCPSEDDGMRLRSSATHGRPIPDRALQKIFPKSR